MDTPQGLDKSNIQDSINARDGSRLLGPQEDPHSKTSEKIESPAYIAQDDHSDPQISIGSSSESIANSPTLNSPDSFLSYVGPADQERSSSYISQGSAFPDNQSSRFGASIPARLNSLNTPEFSQSQESPESLELPLFSTDSGNEVHVRSPKLDIKSYDSLEPSYVCRNPIGSYVTADDEISINADEASFKLPSGGIPLQNAMSLDVYSDSEGGRDGFHSSHNPLFYSSALELEGPSNPTPNVARKQNKSQMNIMTLSQIPNRQKKVARRKSRNSEASERSHRSEAHSGSGYTQTPTSGKIFRNLLILEESLRQQVYQQRTLRRKYLTFLAALCSLIAGISHHLYMSQYGGPFRFIFQLLLLMLIVTLLLYHLSGEYQKTIVLPRKFLSSANKGLRQLNVRLVKIKTSYADSSADLIREYGLFLCSMALKFCHTAFPSMIQNPESRLEIWLMVAQLRCQPRFGLNDVKLVLVPRTFSTDIREGWELYRNEFWVNEGVRRRNSVLDFTKPKPQKKISKEKLRKRRPSAPPIPLLNKHNLNLLEESAEPLNLVDEE